MICVKSYKLVQILLAGEAKVGEHESSIIEAFSVFVTNFSTLGLVQPHGLARN